MYKSAGFEKLERSYWIPKRQVGLFQADRLGFPYTIYDPFCFQSLETQFFNSMCSKYLFGISLPMAIPQAPPIFSPTDTFTSDVMIASKVAASGVCSRFSAFSIPALSIFWGVLGFVGWFSSGRQFDYCVCSLRALGRGTDLGGR